jgi:hypothetical protein
VLPALGQARMSAGKGSRRVTVAALAGRNDVPHNHNDIGSFMLLKHGRLLLVDPGRPIYTRETFGPRRYAILQCRALGHSVPIVNGHEQVAGGQYTGTLATANLDVAAVKAGGGEKALRLDLSRAYPDATLQRLVRTLTLGTDGTLTLEDDYAFSRKPKSVEEGFVTFEPADVAKNGASVTIGTGRRKIQLTAVETAGRFRMDEYPETIETDSQRRLLRRIVFVPATVSATMRLSFSFA